MRSTIPFLLCTNLLACSSDADDPPRDPPGQPAADDDDGTSGGSGPMPTTTVGADEESSSGGSSTETGADDEVPCAGTCLAEVPAQWHGPAAVIRSKGSDPAPNCGTSHPLALTTVFSDLEAAPASCECGCAAAVDVNCGHARATVSDGLGCVDAESSFAIGPDCTNDLVGTGYWSVEFLVEGGSCAPIGNTSVPQAQVSRWTLCGAAEHGGDCTAGETCSPLPLEPFAPGMCIWTEGDVPCPTDGFTERQLAHDEIVDTRSCSECTCGEPDGTCAGGLVEMEMADDCIHSLWWNAEHAECLAGESYFESARVVEAATAIASCDPSPVASIGSASLVGPVTVCCEPERT